MELPLTDIDVFYISYDEPRCEELWADLRYKVPWAKRVHGVKGFDNAHKECARKSDTERLITVDGDNLVDGKFFTKKLTITEEHKNHVFSWAATNAVNGLIYGNGGLKCWTRDVLMNMSTHESADTAEKAVDFCWEPYYLQMKHCYSLTMPNGSPFQAFRAGFREGVKMTLDRGRRFDPSTYLMKAWVGNVNRLRIWCSIGADVENGLWCIYGARLGTAMSLIDGEDINKIADYDWFKSFWEDKIGPKMAGNDETCSYTGYGWDSTKVYDAIDYEGRRLRSSIGLHTCLFNTEESRLYREIQINPSRSDLIMETE